MSKRKCSYKGCQRNIEELGTSFFRFPVKDDDRCLEWILRSGNEELQDLPSSKLRERRICSLHFSLNNFQNDLRKKLNHNAIPLMFQSTIDSSSDRVLDKVHLAKDPPVSLSQDVPILSSTDVADKSITTTKTKRNNNQTKRTTKRDLELKRNIRNLKLRLLRKTRFQDNDVKKDSRGIGKAGIFSEISKLISGAPLTFVKSQLRVGKKVNKWDEEEKKLALALFRCSPKSYKAMLRMGFKLPSVRTIREWINLLHFKPRISKQKLQIVDNVNNDSLYR